MYTTFGPILLCRGVWDAITNIHWATASLSETSILDCTCVPQDGISRSHSNLEISKFMIWSVCHVLISLDIWSGISLNNWLPVVDQNLEFTFIVIRLSWYDLDMYILMRWIEWRVVWERMTTASGWFGVCKFGVKLWAPNVDTSRLRWSAERPANENRSPNLFRIHFGWWVIHWIDGVAGVSFFVVRSRCRFRGFSAGVVHQSRLHYMHGHWFPGESIVTFKTLLVRFGAMGVWRSEADHLAEQNCANRCWSRKVGKGVERCIKYHL